MPDDRWQCINFCRMCIIDFDVLVFSCRGGFVSAQFSLIKEISTVFLKVSPDSAISIGW